MINMSLDIKDIRNYLIQVGYKIEYPILVNAFKKQLCSKDPKLQSFIRTQFKDYVNKLANVVVENNMKFIVLRTEFIPQKDNIPIKQENWIIASCSCNFNAMLEILRHDPKWASQKDPSNGYTALHWAAKFGNLNVIKLVAGTYKISVDIKSYAGYTPLHIACIFDRFEVQELLVKIYRANPKIRDNFGKLPHHYIRVTDE